MIQRPAISPPFRYRSPSGLGDWTASPGHHLHTLSTDIHARQACRRVRLSPESPVRRPCCVRGVSPWTSNRHVEPDPAPSLLVLPVHPSPSRAPPPTTHVSSVSLPTSINGDSVLPVLSPGTPEPSLTVRLSSDCTLSPSGNSSGFSRTLTAPPHCDPRSKLPSPPPPHGCGRPLVSLQLSTPRRNQGHSVLAQSTSLLLCKPRPLRWPSWLRVRPPARCQPRRGHLFPARVTPSPHSVPAGTFLPLDIVLSLS